MNEYSISAVSEDTLMVQWKLDTQMANPELTVNIARLTKCLLDQYADLIINVTPSYQTLLIQFDLLQINVDEVQGIVRRQLQSNSGVNEKTAFKTHEIPVFYDESVAADLTSVADAKQLSVEAIVKSHTCQFYDVYAVGFMPGFAYLGYIAKQLQMPRHSAFRGNVPAGSVGIADRQTAIYPNESPGGWQIIGRSPMAMLEQCQSRLSVGDKVRFISIDRNDYDAF